MTEVANTATRIPLITNIPLSLLKVAITNIQQQALATKREKFLLCPMKM
jgi:hypothetical protein